MLLPLAIAYGYAQHAKHSTEITVFFRVNSSSIDLGYFGNAESLTSLDKTIDMFRMNIDSVSIVAYASPEGNFAYNVDLSSKRAAAMHNFLVNRYNDVDFKNIKEVVGGPDFDGLTRRIEADTQVPYRKEVLDIVRNWGSDPVATFRKLKALRNGVPYNYISYHYLPWLRTATTVIFHYNASVSLYKEQNQQITVSENSSYVLPEASSRARARDDERGNQTGAVSVPCTGTKNTAGNNDNPLAGLPGSGAPAGDVATVPVHGNQPNYSVLPILDQQAGSDAEAVYAAGYAAGYAAASSGAPYGQGVYANQPQGDNAGQGAAAGATGAGAAAGAGAAGAGAGAAAYGQSGQGTQSSNAGQGAAAGAGAADAGAAAYGQGGQGGTGAAAGAAYGQSTQGGQSGAAAGTGAGAGAGAAAYGQSGQGTQSSNAGAATGAGAAYGQGGQGSQSGAAAGAGYGQGSNAGQGSSTGAAAAAGYGDGNRSDNNDNKDNKGGQDGAKSFTFVFPVGGSEIDTTRADNAEALQALRQALDDGYIVEGSRVMVHAYASPDGPAKANKMLSQRRAESAVIFLEDVLPEDTKVDYVSEGENWEGFKESVEKNYNRPDRDKVLAILSSDKSVDEKKKEINKLDPESRKELVGKTSESLRSVKVTLLPPEEKPEEKTEEKAEPAPVVVVREADTTVVAPVAVDTTSAIAAITGDNAADSVASSPAVDSTATVAIDSTAIAPVDSLANQAAADSTKQRKPRGTIVALKTNLLYDLVTAVNVEVEIPVAKRFSIAVENVFPWWETGNKYCFQLWEMGIEGRIWLKAWDVRGREKLRGLFAGIYGMSGKYDFQFDRKINYQGEFWSVGATIGYSMPLGRKEWGNLEFSVSDGYLKSPYRHYYPTEDYSKLLRDRGNQGTLYSYFVYPTKAKVSLVIPIPGKKKKEANHE